MMNSFMKKRMNEFNVGDLVNITTYKAFRIESYDIRNFFYLNADKAVIIGKSKLYDDLYKILTCEGTCWIKHKNISKMRLGRNKRPRNLIRT